jgi:hypothetical protein
MTAGRRGFALHQIYRSTIESAKRGSGVKDNQRFAAHAVMREKFRMKLCPLITWIALLMSLVSIGATQSSERAKMATAPSYLGFDRNNYPGDAALPVLRKTFRYMSYWLNNPPGETVNSWAGKRAILRQNDFGFLVLFTGRTDDEIKAAAASGQSAGQLGEQDGKAAVVAAARERFPRNVLIFLDQEEGGRLLPEQAAYLFGWVDAVREGGARPGVYCSGIDVPDGAGTINTAEDIAGRETAAELASCQNMPRGSEICIGHEGDLPVTLVLWIANDVCPPAPGCAMSAPQLESGVSESLRHLATVWQFAQSPRRAQFSAGCPRNQAQDGNCYAPGLSADVRMFVDLDAADSPDPSGGR